MVKYKVLTDRFNTFFTNNKVIIGISAPTTGTHVAGDIVISSSANATAFGWICTVSGTWMDMYSIWYAWNMESIDIGYRCNIYHMG